MGIGEKLNGIKGKKNELLKQRTKTAKRLLGTLLQKVHKAL
jgi:hypothetical protein